MADPARVAVVTALRQVRDGADIPPPGTLLKNVTPTRAALELPNSPYSILTNLAHADFWQTVWLNRLKGLPAKSFTEDWKTPDPEAWPELRQKFLQDLEEALRIAESEPFAHRMKSDEVAIFTLLQIAIHDSYHLGQINLLKRQIRLASRAS